jgi:hypothetical protein
LRIPGPGVLVLRLATTADPPLVWSRETPENLYLFSWPRKDDGAAVRFGYRTVALDGPDFLLNGARDFWWGINRHSDYADIGSVETAAAVERRSTSCATCTSIRAARALPRGAGCCSTPCATRLHDP